MELVAGLPDNPLCADGVVAIGIPRPTEEFGEESGEDVLRGICCAKWFWDKAAIITSCYTKEKDGRMTEQDVGNDEIGSFETALPCNEGFGRNKRRVGSMARRCDIGRAQYEPRILVMNVDEKRVDNRIIVHPDLSVTFSQS